ncbi:copper resistance protein CopC [Pseudonocardia sp. GCM10023141]|uniref:copper resistance protein CopC n=1 Tax=Pseudonocardia sp. GCM10023141 TaxID=3252653 RepID=UPI00360C9C85
MLVAASWGTLLLTTPIPAGDPVLLSTSPGNDEFVKSPNELRLTFDRPVSAGLAMVQMTAPLGQQLVEARPQNVPGDANSITVPMPKTRYGGTYSVAWSLPTSWLEQVGGASNFHVVEPTNPVAFPNIPTDRDPVVASVHAGFRLAATAALALVVGLAFVLTIVWPAGAQSPQVRRLITYSWLLMVVATLGTIATLGAYAARVPLQEAFDPALVSAGLGSDIGAGLLAGLIVIAPGTVALVHLLTSAPADAALQRWLRAGTVLGCAAASAMTWAFAAPHAPDGPSPITVGTEIALLIAVAACLGGPVLLWVLLRTPGDSVLCTALPRLVVLMPVSATLLLAIASLATTGWQMIALMVLGAVVLGTGLASRWWMRRRVGTRGRDLPGRTRLRRIAAVAAVAMAVSLFAGGAAAAATGPADLAQSGSPSADQQPVPAAPPEAVLPR